ncbi:Tannase and feruloyl esterase [Sphingomonas laterariae]|uniref:Tannase and feruloyl esterase n=2 Tax=Edaphosphingomonas laterariae TaxID=861865 RepID=A0A239KFG6_9SPHN|nr:Tannase and feruloyl esterase [Sphingomonas laterariae]
MAASRYPADFDGVVAGAPVVSLTLNNSIYHAWIVQNLMRRDGGLRMTDAQLARIHALTVTQCGRRQKEADGILRRPELCQPDLASLACKAEPVADCLKAEDIQAAEAMYQGVRGAYFGVEPGSELGWNRQAAASHRFATSFLTTMTGATFKGEQNPFDARFDAASIASYQGLAGELDAPADIKAFAERGGKLIIWHGWADTGVPPRSSLDYVARLRAQLGGSAVERFVRLYMLPGVEHCSGGNGPDRFDGLSAVMEWVERGVSPRALPATNHKPDSPRWTVAPYADGPAR